MPLSAADTATAQAAIELLKSEKYKNQMYLFLTPFDVNQVPGYMDVVQKKLDLQTVEEWFHQGSYYNSLGEFWADLTGIFENAIKYHSTQPTKWIAKLAKDMLKVVQREQKGEKQAKKIKIRVKGPATAGSPDASATGSSPALTPQEESSTGTSDPAPKKKVSLKIKLPTQGNKAEAKQAIKAKPTQPKLKLKLSIAKATGPRAPSTPMIPGELEALPAASVPPATAPLPAAPSLAKPPSAAPLAVKAKPKPKSGAKQIHAAASAPPETSTTTPAATTSKPKKKNKEPSKLTLKLGGPSRGKELPKGVVLKKKTTSPKSTASGSAAPSKHTPGASAPLPSPPVSALQPPAAPPTAAAATIAKTKKKKVKNLNFPYAPATKVLAGLKRRQNKSIAWFLQPVSDKAILADYKAKIRHPMDLQTMSSKLERNNYANAAAFVVDLRRIFANCLQYNTSIKDSLRPVAVEVLETAEQLCSVFLTGHPPLLYCWKLCIGVLDTLYNLVNPEDGQPTALYFLHPVSYYCGGAFPPDYSEKVPKPMDFGTVTSNLLEGKYQVVDEFCNDCRLVLHNCVTYYNGREDGKLYIEQANRLNEVLSQQLEQLTRYVKSSRGAADQARAAIPVVLDVPPVPALVSLLEEMRALKYTDKATKITEPAMGPFERPVSLSAFPDYTQHVEVPMDLHTIELKVKSHSYRTPEDFEYDVNLTFKNCEVYNSRRNGDHLVAMAKFATRQFRRIFYAKMRAIEDPSSIAPPPTPPSAVEVATGTPTAGGTKKVKSEGAVSKGKIAPRISITAAQVSSAALNAARAKSPGNTISGTKKSQATSLQPQQASKADQPVPLHIAIARVKEAFPIRRPHKQLQPWEADCARYFKELMRHPWISAARPKFIFHVPVPTLFPELREAYASKIRKPMDLTTVECTLLQGNRYTQPDDFLQDVALVFANAVRFNKDGRDIGDPLSCAYYDASVHLLRYSRWLSLEILLPYSDSSSEHVDEPTPDGLPPFSWRLTEGNRKRAREEMEKLVMSEPLDKSLEGDRYSWHEAECEKLLKALRHQADVKYMTYFIQANYPADYTAFIAKPMDWEKESANKESSTHEFRKWPVQRRLKKRQYDKFGDVVDDLRLIFSNALKYNARMEGTDTVNGRAFEAAKYMSAKLEAAVTKLLLSVSDRLERERIDHANAEREIEAAEQAEEARIREAWKNPKDGEREGAPPPGGVGTAGSASGPEPSSRASSADAAVQKIRLVRRAAQLRETTDFEIPFFEEDHGQHERSYFEFVKFQKALFEKQRESLSRMRQCTAAIGTAVLSRQIQDDRARLWLQREVAGRRSGSAPAPGAVPGGGASSFLPPPPTGSVASAATPSLSGSTVLEELERKGRTPVQIQLQLSAKSQPRRKQGLKRKAPPGALLEDF